MIALANEVAANKISSEEETWSDQSLLIFRHNARGIRALATPFQQPIATRAPTRWTGLLGALDGARAAVDAVYGPVPVVAASYAALPAAPRRLIADRFVILRDALRGAAETLELKV